MKSILFVDLSDGQIVVSHFLVREKEVRTSVRTGSSWLAAGACGPHRRPFPGKMWDNFTALSPIFDGTTCSDSRPREAV